MRCEEIMKKNVQCLKPNDTVKDAAACMRDNNVGFLPICQDDKTVAGVITDRDIACRVVADGKDFNTPVQSFMSTDSLAYVKASDDVQQAKDLMAQRKVSRVFVCDDNCRIEGVISLSDIAQNQDASDTMRKVTTREAAPA
jgi:CBS domain-containing protein